MTVPRARIFEMMSSASRHDGQEIAEDHVLTGIVNLRTFNRLRLLPHNREALRDRAASGAERYDVAGRLGCGRPGQADARARAQRRLSVAVK
jgi:hypothetical protein